MIRFTKDGKVDRSEWGRELRPHGPVVVPPSAGDFADALDLTVAALNNIASWDEGEEVSGLFDCPYHATEARDILRKIGAAK